MQDCQNASLILSTIQEKYVVSPESQYCVPKVIGWKPLSPITFWNYKKNEEKCPSEKQTSTNTNKNKKQKKKKNAFKKREKHGQTPYLKFCEMQFFSAYISHLMFSSKFKTAPSLYQQRYLFQSRSQKKLRKGKYGKRQFKLEISRKSTNDLRTSLEK